MEKIRERDSSSVLNPNTKQARDVTPKTKPKIMFLSSKSFTNRKSDKDKNAQNLDLSLDSDNDDSLLETTTSKHVFKSTNSPSALSNKLKFEFDTVKKQYPCPYTKQFKPKTPQHCLDLKLHTRNFIKGYLYCFCMRILVPGENKAFQHLHGYGRLCTDCLQRVYKINLRNPVGMTSAKYLKLIEKDINFGKQVDLNPAKVRAMIQGGYLIEFKYTSPIEEDEELDEEVEEAEVDIVNDLIFF